MNPNPLQGGAVLDERFEVTSVLGRGGFGIAYLAIDHRLGDRVVVKELAPSGVPRNSDDQLDLDGSGLDGPRLRQSLLDEARMLARLNIRGILPVRSWFSQNSTAYYVTPYLSDSQTLQQMIETEGRMDPSWAMDVFLQLLETLEALHARGILHRDIKPSNVLIDPKGVSYLIDFGSARTWQADRMATHTVMFTPGYAPPEQLSEKARRGPATDIYGLCATLYHMISGVPPIPSTERVAGVELTPIQDLNPEVENAVAAAIHAGMSLKFAERPQSAAELRQLLTYQEDPAIPDLGALDATLVRLAKFTFSKRACPACGGLLEKAQPLRKWTCPVCGKGQIHRRRIEERLCPVCRNGAVQKVRQEEPFTFCPCCHLGLVTFSKRSLLSSVRDGRCDSCQATFEVQRESIVRRSPLPQEERTPSEWRQLAARPVAVYRCNDCGAQFDAQTDGRRKQVHPLPKGPYKALYPDEWARLAVGLDPGSGNAECDSCGADYYADETSITLLSSAEDDHAFVREHLGRRIDLESARWLGVGKTSGLPGVVCQSCPTEFNWDGADLQLVRTKHPKLARRSEETLSLEDWHRVAQGLPTDAEEESFLARIDETILEAYIQGKLGFDDENTVWWRGPAYRTADRVEATLTIRNEELVHGSLLKKWRLVTDDIAEAEAQKDTLTLWTKNRNEPIEFELDPMELTVQLKSGPRTITLTAAALAARMRGYVAR